jgi:primosomal protein N' (replication factor Y) (superfamily II helicase)
MDVQTDWPDASGRVAQVLFPLPLWEAYDYAEPEGMDLEVGDVVVAPLGPRTVTGVVAGFKPAAGTNRRLRLIIGRLDAPQMPPRALAFARWAADYAADAPGAALALALRGLGAPRPSPRQRFIASAAAPARMTVAKSKVLAIATAPMTRAELARVSAVSAGVVADLIRVGALVPAMIDQPADAFRDEAPSALNDSQAAAAEAIGSMVKTGSFSVALLDGVTGSGKTEVYLEAAATALGKSPGAQVLVLLPEIALTEAVLRRFEARFGAAPAQWHSGVAGPRRRETWEAVAEGRSRVVVGARSALFLPFIDLRLIIVDEEHDASYKQDEGFVYHARDLAVARGKIEGTPVVLASATPSLETLWNARSGRYRHLRLEDRHGAASLPEVSLIDLRENPPETGRWLSPPLVGAIRETLARGEQSLLFLNRRGYAPLVICRSCGERMKAPDTDSWLVEHRYSRRLVCHLTGFSMPRPERCPTCAAADSLVSVGPGVERVEEEARLLFPEARIVVFSSDTAPDARSARVLIEAMERGDFDIMVATQSAAKGHNFPKLTLVGVVDADVGLRGGDLRAAERTFQLLTQVAGRAGRADRPGRALIQTWAPEHAVMQAIALQDRDGFVSTELSEREALGLPPFGRLAAVILSSQRGDVLEDFARAFASAAPNAEGVTIFGPADAPLALVRGRRRKRFLIRAERSVDLQSFLLAWRARRPPPNSVRIDIDVDPYNFL